jgi:hypothetical protein
MWAGKPLAVRWLLCSFCLLWASPPAWCGSAALALRPAVEVDHSPVLLSDLLPADADAAIQKASALVVLCAAPQAGSVRLLHAEELMRAMAAHPGLLPGLSIPSRVTVRYSRRLIQQAAVRNAISDFLRAHTWGELPQTANLEWPESLAAREDHAQLQVTAVAWDERRQTPQFRLGCTQHSACADFVVHVVLPASVADAWQRNLASPTSLRLAAGANSIPSGPLLARRGKAAILVFEGGGMRVSLPVICTEPGTLNQRIRVFDRQSQRLFYADVVGEGLLHASL